MLIGLHSLCRQNFKMNLEIKALLKEFKKIISLKAGFDFELFCDPKWASTYTDHRLKIRKSLYHKTEQKNVLDLSQTPKLNDFESSISHCPVMGGYCYSKNAIGLDLEQFQRISPSLIQRISNDDEILNFDNYGTPLLWTVKESTYKASKKYSGSIPEVRVNLKPSCFETESLSVVVSQTEFREQRYQNFSFVEKKLDLVLSVSFKI